MAAASSENNHADALDVTPLRGYYRERRIYIDRHLHVDLAKARAGEDAGAGQRILAFAVSERDHGYPPHREIVDFLIDACCSAIAEFDAARAAYLKRAPGSGVQPPLVDVNSHLGLLYRGPGRPKDPSECRTEVARDVLDQVMLGVSRVVAIEDAANRHGVEFDTVAGWVKAHRPSYTAELGAELWRRACALLEDRDRDNAEAIRAATTQAIETMSRSSGMAPKELRRVLNRFLATIGKFGARS